MSLASGVAVQDQALTAFKEFHQSGTKANKTKFIIFKITDNKKEVALDEESQQFSHDPDYEVFRTQLTSAKDANGNPAPRYAVYDVEFEIPGEGKRSKIIFISWVPTEAPTIWSMLYASTRETLKQALNITNSIHADDKGDIEYKTVLNEVSAGKGV